MISPNRVNWSGEQKMNLIGMTSRSLPSDARDTGRITATPYHNS
jgi:hypothetical protein